MSAYELAVGIHPDSHFFPVPVHDRVIAFLAFASFFCDPKNLIASGFFLDGGLRQGWQVLHVYGSLRLRQRGWYEDEADTGAAANALLSTNRFEAENVAQCCAGCMIPAHSVNATSRRCGS